MKQFKTRFKNIFRTIDERKYPTAMESESKNYKTFFIVAFILISIIYISFKFYDNNKINKLIQGKLPVDQTIKLCEELAKDREEPQCIYFKYCQSDSIEYYKCLFYKYYNKDTLYNLNDIENSDFISFTENWKKELIYLNNYKESPKFLRKDMIKLHIYKDLTVLQDEKSFVATQENIDYIFRKSKLVYNYLEKNYTGDLILKLGKNKILLNKINYYHILYGHFFREHETSIDSALLNKTYFTNYKNLKKFSKDLITIFNELNNLGVEVILNKEGNQFILINLEGINYVLAIHAQKIHPQNYNTERHLVLRSVYNIGEKDIRGDALSTNYNLVTTNNKKINLWIKK